jgi:hypothetical protein
VFVIVGQYANSGDMQMLQQDTELFMGWLCLNRLLTQQAGISTNILNVLEDTTKFIP